MNMNWYSLSELVSFAHVLKTLDAFVVPGGDEADELLRFFEKPWKWDAEHEAWVRLGRPSPEDPVFEDVRSGMVLVIDVLK